MSTTQAPVLPCHHCGAQIKWTASRSGREGWSDGRRDPFFCPNAINFQHRPTGAAS